MLVLVSVAMIVGGAAIWFLEFASVFPNGCTNSPGSSALDSPACPPPSLHQTAVDVINIAGVSILPVGIATLLGSAAWLSWRSNRFMLSAALIVGLSIYLFTAALVMFRFLP